MIVKHADGIAGTPVSTDAAGGVVFRLLIGPDDGAANFHMRRFDIAPGGHTPRHAHAWEHEVYLVAGSGVVWSPGGERAIAAGDCVFVPGGEEHQFRNTGAEELKMLCMVPAAATSTLPAKGE